ncbi:GPI inositol deacylase [Thecaphora frezii]
MPSPTHAGNGGGAASASRRPPRPLLALALVLVASISLLAYALSSFATLPSRLDVAQQCRMSRMWPAYVDHTPSLAPFSPSHLWRSYRLYLYRERSLHPSDHPSGSPALFIPGNAGSYAQIRSVASSAARQWYQPNTQGMRRPEWQDLGQRSAHTDWWTIDFNEDFSAFSASSLLDQATFINEVIAYLRDLYPAPATASRLAGERNVTVPLLAHSMGGIAARIAPTLPNHPPHSVDTIVTLSTPHAFPPAPFDRRIDRLYRHALRSSATSHGDATQPLLVSIAGGLLDSQLPSDPASLSLAGLVAEAPASRLSSFTASLPSLWSSVDHLAIMWCDQLREKVARGFLLDVVTFGRIADERNGGGGAWHDARSAPSRRRELWRRVLGVAHQSDGGSLAARSANQDDDDGGGEVLVDAADSPTLPMPLEGANSVLATNTSNAVYHRPASVDGEAPLAFEVVTNLCVGAKPSDGSGPPTPQPVEIVVLLCRRAADPSNPIRLSKAVCEPALPWRWQMMPPSPLPTTTTNSSSSPGEGLRSGYPPEFPDAHRIYHVPGQAYQRLRLDADTLRRKDIDFVRVEAKVDDGLAVKEHGEHSFVRAEWVRELGGGVVEGSGGVAVLEQQPQASLVSEWRIRGKASALLAYELEVVPSKCLLRNVARNVATYVRQPSGARHAAVPAFAPALRVSDPTTGDSRWFPSLVPRELVESLGDARRTRRGEEYAMRVRFALHGRAPFLPPGADEVHVQLWSDPALLGLERDDECAAALERLTLRIDWRGSAGLVVMRYRLVVVAWPVALLACVVAKMWCDASCTAERRGLASLLDYLTGRWTVLHLLPGVTAALLGADTLQRVTYSGGDATSWSVGAVVGMPQPAKLAWILVPALVVVSYQVLLSVSLVVHHGMGAVAYLVERLGLAGRVAWSPTRALSIATRLASYRRPFGRPSTASVAGAAALVLAVVVAVPHAFVFVVVCLLHVANTVRSRVQLDALGRGSRGGGRGGEMRCEASGDEDVGQDEEPDEEEKGVRGYAIVPTASEGGAAAEAERVRARYNEHLALLVVMLLLLPPKATVLVVWARKLSAGVWLPLSTGARWMDHNPLDVAPMVGVCWIYTLGGTLCSGGGGAKGGWRGKAVAAAWWTMGMVGMVAGGRRPWVLYEAGLGVAWMGLAMQVGKGGAKRREDEVGGMLQQTERGGRGSGVWGRELPVLEKEAEEEEEEEEEERNAEESRDAADAPTGPRPNDDEERTKSPGPSGVTRDDAAGVSTSRSNSIGNVCASHSAGTELDALLEHYLGLLDRYLQLQSQASSHLAAGFLALSSAKMQIPRLGRDLYDYRIKADVEVVVRRGKLEVVRKQQSRPEGKSQRETQQAGMRRRNPHHAQPEKSEKGKEEGKSEAPKTNTRMFAPLPPPMLRKAEGHFENALARLLGAAPSPPQAGGECILDILHHLQKVEAMIRDAAPSHLERVA